MNNKRIIITVEGGLVQDIQGIPCGVEIEVRDFDTDYSAIESLKEDEDGNHYIEIIHESSEVEDLPKLSLNKEALVFLSRNLDNSALLAISSDRGIYSPVEYRRVQR